VLGIALVARLGQRLYDRRTGLWAALFLALSPFDILFARTAFTDPMLVLWMLVALLGAANERSFWAGLALGLAFATKQHAVTLVPLVVLVAWAARSGKRHVARAFSARPFIVRSNPRKRVALNEKWIRPVILGLLGFAIPFALVTWWDSARWMVRPGYWRQSSLSYGGLPWAAPAEWGARLVEWGGWARYLVGSPALYALLLVGSGALVVRFRRRPRRAPGKDALVVGSTGHSGGALQARPTKECPKRQVSPSEDACSSHCRPECHSGLMVRFRHRTEPSSRKPASRVADACSSARLYDTLLLGYALGYVTLHTILRFSIWDRYLLPLAPLAALLLARVVVEGLGYLERMDLPQRLRQVGRAFSAPSRWLARRLRGLRLTFAAVVCLAACYSACRAALNGYPVGGEHWAYQGLDQVIAYLRENAAPDAVLYHHWLRWHYTYYLYGTDFELRWWQSAAHLRQEASRTPGREQYIVLPDWRTLEPEAEGIELVPLYETRRRDGSVSLRVYRVEVE
jgi:hypothetical protein